VTAVIMGLL